MKFRSPREEIRETHEGGVGEREELAARDLHIAAVLIGRQTIRAKSRQMKGRERPLGTSLIPILRLWKGQKLWELKRAADFWILARIDFWPPIEFVPFEFAGKQLFFPGNQLPWVDYRNQHIWVDIWAKFGCVPMIGWIDFEFNSNFDDIKMAAL